MTTRTVRVGTVVWGAILLVIAAVAFGGVVFDLREFQGAAVAWIVTGLGGVFVVGAIVALIARAVSTSSTTEGGSTTEETTTEKDQPTG